MEQNSQNQSKNKNTRLWGLILVGVVVAFVVVVVNRQAEDRAQMSVETGTGVVTGLKPVTTEDVVANEVTLVIENGADSAEYALSDIPEGATAFDLFGLADINILYDDYSFGKLVTTINGLESGENDMFWIYYINGKQATVGADSYVVELGDEVKWVYEENIYK